jgi:hypothetical protein
MAQIEAKKIANAATAIAIAARSPIAGDRRTARLNAASSSRSAA